jgi:hypothetical protein
MLSIVCRYLLQCSQVCFLQKFLSLLPCLLRPYALTRQSIKLLCTLIHFLVLLLQWALGARALMIHLCLLRLPPLSPRAAPSKHFRALCQDVLLPSLLPPPHSPCTTLSALALCQFWQYLQPLAAPPIALTSALASSLTSALGSLPDSLAIATRT